MDLILIILSIGIVCIVLTFVWTLASTAYELWNDWKNKNE